MNSSSTWHADEDQSSKLVRKANVSPFVPIGILGAASVMAVLYRLKSYRAIKLSPTVIEFAKCSVIGTAIAGVGIGMIDYWEYRKRS